MKKEIKILSAVLLVLASIVTMLFLQDKETETMARFVDFTIEDVHSFKVSHFTQASIFQRHDTDGWQIKRIKSALAEKLEKDGQSVATVDENFKPVKTDLVAKALTYMTELEGSEPIATVNDELATYEINDYSLHVVFLNKEGKELETVYIGKHGPEALSTFIKKKDSRNIYLARQNFRDLYFRDVNDWLVEKNGKK